MAPSAFHPGEHFDALQDELRDMGCPAPEWGRDARHDVWLRVMLPGRNIGTYTPAESVGSTLDLAAKAMIDIELTAGDKETEDAQQAEEQAA